MPKTLILFFTIIGLFVLVACDESDSSTVETSPEVSETSPITTVATETSIEETNIQDSETSDVIIDDDVVYIERIHHLIEENETLEDIANIHHTTVEILKQINWFVDPEHLLVGTQLRIPPAGFPLLQNIEINISKINIEDIDQIDADIIFDFDRTGSTFLVEIYSDVQDIQMFSQDLSTGPRQPYVSPIIGYIRTDSIPGQILLLNCDITIPTLNVGIKFTDNAGMDRYFVIGWTPMLDIDPWIIYDFTVEFWSSKD